MEQIKFYTRRLKRNTCSKLVHCLLACVDCYMCRSQDGSVPISSRVIARPVPGKISFRVLGHLFHGCVLTPLSGCGYSLQQYQQSLYQFIICRQSPLSC